MDITELRTAMQEHQQLLIDSMVFIYLLDNHPVYADLAAAVLESVEKGEVTAVTSTLTLSEVLTGPARAGDDEAFQDYELYLTHFPHLRLLPVTTAVARVAAKTRAATGLRTPDAIQLATAQLAGVTAVVGNDKGWRGKTGNLALLLLNDYLSA